MKHQHQCLESSKGLGELDSDKSASQHLYELNASDASGPFIRSRSPPKTLHFDFSPLSGSELTVANILQQVIAKRTQEKEAAEARRKDNGTEPMFRLEVGNPDTAVTRKWFLDQYALYSFTG